RLPRFYQDFDVPDTVDARFDMVVLHLWMTLRRLKSAPEGEALSQALFDHFCSDMDHNLRELGVGDLTVPKKMQAVGQAFYGRSHAYDAAIEQGGAAMPAALARNILNNPDDSSGGPLAGYVTAALAGLAAIDDKTIRQGAWHFPEPVI